MEAVKTYSQLLAENETMRWQLEEATETLHAIRTGQIDALVVQSGDGTQLYSLKTADQTYRMFIEKMNEGAVTLNAEGIILYCNSMFAQMVELPLSRVLGSTFDTFIPDYCRQDYQQLFNGGWTADAKLELPVRGASGPIPCQLSVTTLQLDDGVSMSVIVTDLSYQKKIQELLKANNARLEKANAALEKSNQDLLQFASVASHDLQEPLRKIMVFSGMIRSRLAANAPGDESAVMLEKIVTSSRRLKVMISDILAYSRLSQDSITTEPVSLQEVIAEIIDDLEILIAEKSATIDVADLPTVTANRGQMRQTFQNLLSNALKFSRPGVAPHVRIGSTQTADGAAYIITVADNGIGFSEQYSDKIFSLFQRLNTKDQYEGSGIGLAVAKKIVDAHNGSISVSSEEGVGSVFSVTLPVTPGA